MSAAAPARWPTVLLLTAVAVLAFVRALSNGPIEDDVPLRRVRLAHVARVSDVPALLVQSYWGDVHAGAGLYRPLTLATLGVQKILWGDDLRPTRLLSLALHVACTLLVWRLGRLILTAPGGALLSALLFAVHPIHAEAVVTLYGQCDLWAALFALWATALHVRWAAGGRGSSWWLAIAALYLLSLGFKESAILLPPLLGVLRGLVVDRDARGWRRWFGPREAIVAAAALGLYLPLRAFALGGDLAPAADAVVGRGAGPASRVALAVVAVATDLRLLTLPWGQTVYYGHLRDRLAAGGVAEALFLLAAIYALRRLCTPDRPWTLAALAMFAFHLLPVANLVPIGVLVAERCLYLPSAGFALLVGGWVATWAGPPRPAMYFAAAAMLVAAAGIALSARVCGRWSDARVLWSNTLADHPRSPRAGAMDVLFRIPVPEKQPHLSAAQAAELRRQLDGVERLNPELPELWLARAALAHSTGDDRAAQACLARAEALRPGIRRSMPFVRLPSTPAD